MMNCDFGLLINGQTKPISLGNFAEDTKFTFNQLVNFIKQLPIKDREALADLLKSAKAKTLTEKDIKDYIFISNTNLDELFEQYPQFKELYGDLEISPHDDYTFIMNKKVNINGQTYYGKVTKPDGSTIFIFSQSEYSVEKLLKYLKIKKLIDEHFKEDKLIEKLSKYQEKLEIITKKFNKTTNKELLLDFLDNKSKYKSFKTKDNKTIEVQLILNTILSEIIQEYSTDTFKSDLHLNLIKINKSEKNFEYYFNIKNLHKVLSLYDENIKSVEELSNMSFEELKEYIEDYFSFDPRLLNLELVKVEQGKTETVTKEAQIKPITQDVIKKKYLEYKKQVDTKERKLPPFNKLIESDVNIRDIFSNIFLDGYEGYEINKIEIKDGKIKIFYIIPEHTKEVEQGPFLYFKDNYFKQLGEVYNFGYDTETLFTPVKKTEDNGLDEDGMYHGVYIFEYHNEKSKEINYVISRNLISPSTKKDSFSSLEEAKYTIDHKWAAQHTLKEYGLYSIKSENNRRTSFIEAGNFNVGQLITVLDLQLPITDLKTLPLTFKNIFEGSLLNFKTRFKDVPNIEKVNTPEKAAYFLLALNKKIIEYDQEVIKKARTRASENEEILTRVTENKLKTNYAELDDLIKIHSQSIAEIINEIQNARTINYKIESKGQYKKHDLATLTYVPNVTSLQDTFKKAYEININSLRNAVNYFSKRYNLNITIYSAQELKEFSDKENLNLNLETTKAFVYNGNIYLNAATANESDLFHEIAHIFLGILKVKDIDVYNKFINSFVQDSKFQKAYDSKEKIYKHYSQQDIIEEVIVDKIAKQLYRNEGLLVGFQDEDFENAFQSIFNEFKTILNSDKTNDMSYPTIIKTLLTEEVKSKIQRNMKISTLIKQMIENETIKENCK